MKTTKKQFCNTSEICRSNKPFNKITKEITEDSTLSDSAFRLLIKLLNNSEKWIINLEQTCMALKFSERKSRRSIKELKDRGFLVSKNFFNENNKIIWNHFITEDPSVQNEPMEKKPYIQNDPMENLTTNNAESSDTVCIPEYTEQITPQDRFARVENGPINYNKEIKLNKEAEATAKANNLNEDAHVAPASASNYFEIGNLNVNNMCENNKQQNVSDQEVIEDFKNAGYSSEEASRFIEYQNKKVLGKNYTWRSNYYKGKLESWLNNCKTAVPVPYSTASATATEKKVDDSMIDRIFFDKQLEAERKMIELEFKLEEKDWRERYALVLLSNKIGDQFKKFSHLKKEELHNELVPIFIEAMKEDEKLSVLFQPVNKSMTEAA